MGSKKIISYFSCIIFCYYGIQEILMTMYYSLTCHFIGRLVIWKCILQRPI